MCAVSECGMDTQFPVLFPSRNAQSDRTQACLCTDTKQRPDRLRANDKRSSLDLTTIYVKQTGTESARRQVRFVRCGSVFTLRSGVHPFNFDGNHRGIRFPLPRLISLRTLPPAIPLRRRRRERVLFHLLSSVFVHVR